MKDRSIFNRKSEGVYGKAISCVHHTLTMNDACLMALSVFLMQSCTYRYQMSPIS